MLKQKKRNLIAINPLLKKGGVHQKTNKAKRKRDKQMLKGQQTSWPFCWWRLKQSF